MEALGNELEEEQRRAGQKERYIGQTTGVRHRSLVAATADKLLRNSKKKNKGDILLFLFAVAR